MIKELLKDMAKYLPSYVVPAIVGLFTIPVVTRLFPPEDYGNYVLVLVTISIFSVIVGWLSMSIIRFYPVYERDNRLKNFYYTTIVWLIISIVALTLIFSCFLFILKVYFTNQLFHLMLVGTLVFILTSCFQVLQHFLRAKRQVGWYTGFSVWKSITSLGIGITFIVGFQYGIEGLLWGQVFSLIISLPLLMRISMKNYFFRNKSISTNLTKNMAKYGFPLVIGNMAAWILSLSDRYILELFRGSHEVGIYSASYAISENSILLVASLFWLASTPIEMSIWVNQGEKASQVFISELTRYYLIVGFPATVGLSILAKPVIAVFTEAKYHQGYTIIPIVAFGVFLLGLQRRFQSGLAFHKKTNLIMAGSIISGLVNIVLNLIFIPIYGYMAAALTTLFSYAFLLVIMVIVSRKFFIWEFPFKSLAKAIIASATMGIVVYFASSSLTISALLNLILSIVIGMTIYSMMLFLLREFRQSEIQVLVTLKEKFWEKLNEKIKI